MKRRRSTAGSSGFTLLELLVVLTIAGLMLGIGVPRLSDSIARARLRTTAETVASALRVVRASAMRRSEPDQLSIDRSRRAYRAEGKSFALPAGQTLALIPFNVNPGDSPDGGAADQTVLALEFLPDGSSSGGTILVTGGTRRAQIDIDWLSGRVSVRD